MNSSLPPQELCLVSEDGSGARYMAMFDQYPQEVRNALRCASVNICCACFNDLYQSRLYCHEEIIHHFERGTINDLRERVESARRYGPKESFRDIYGRPDRAPFDFYDPPSRAARDFADLARRELQGRMEQWQREYFDNAAFRDYGQTLKTPVYVGVDWATAFEPAEFKELTVKRKRRGRPSAGQPETGAS